jgi:hypothetical protein
MSAASVSVSALPGIDFGSSAGNSFEATGDDDSVTTSDTTVPRWQPRKTNAATITTDTLKARGLKDLRASGSDMLMVASP